MFSVTKTVGLFLACVTCFAAIPGSVAAQDNGLKTNPSMPVQQGSIGLKLVHDDNGNLEMMIMDASGNKEVLTFGNFISFSVAAILQGAMDNCSINQTQPIYVGYEWKGKTLFSSITTVDGKKSPFSIPSFLGTLSDTLVRCRSYTEVNNMQPANTAAIMFDKSSGNLQTMIMNVNGKAEKLNLGNLLSISSVAFPDCAPGVEKERVLQIFVDSSKPDNLKVYQVDAYGLKEDFNFDNLSTAAAETLESCAKDSSKGFTALQPNSIKIKFEKTASGDIQSYLMTNAGDTVELNLGTLLTAAAQTVPFYRGKTDMLMISYSKDKSGVIKGTLTDLSGNMMDLNIQNLVKSAAVFYTY